MHLIKIPEPWAFTLCARGPFTSRPDLTVVLARVPWNTCTFFFPSHCSLLPNCRLYCDAVIIGGPPASVFGSVLSCDALDSGMTTCHMTGQSLWRQEPDSADHPKVFPASHTRPGPGSKV